MWQFNSDTELVAPSLDQMRVDTDNGNYTFDKILLESSQEQMYRHAAKETVKQFTKGFNGTIFAYGQSGSGKTFSMLGPEEVVEFIKSGEMISEDT